MSQDGGVPVKVAESDVPQDSGKGRKSAVDDKITKRTYKCTICSRTYSVKRQFEKHCARHTKGETLLKPSNLESMLVADAGKSCESAIVSPQICEASVEEKTAALEKAGTETCDVEKPEASHVSISSLEVDTVSFEKSEPAIHANQNSETDSDTPSMKKSKQSARTTQYVCETCGKIFK